LPFAARVKRMFLTGLVILAPVALSVYVLLLIFRFMDGIFAPQIQAWVDPFIPGFYVPGLGVILTLLVVLVLGWLSNNVVGRRVMAAVERLIQRVPVGGAIYAATKGVMEALSRDRSEAFKRVVLVEYPRVGLFSLAFVTGSDRWPEVHPATEDFVLVFLPTTPNPTSGYLLLVPREQAIDLDMTVEEGVRMVISGGILRPETLRRSVPEGSVATLEGC
jgi:uncharacterized membrane protein